jgi:hypothetical protein
LVLLQTKIKNLEAQCAADYEEKKNLRAALDSRSEGTALQPSSAGVDDEDDEMDMEEGGGGSSSGTAVEEQYSFKSGPVFVKRAGASDSEARQFAADQKEEMAQYMQSLSRPSAASSSGAAGGSVLSDLDIVLHSLDSVRDLHEKYKQLEAENVTLKKKAKHSKSMEAMAVSVCVCIH